MNNIDGLLIGFEFEGGIDDDYYDEFCTNLGKLGVNSIGDDSSLNFSGIYASGEAFYSPIEFRTPPKHFDEGIKILDDILIYLELMTAAKLFKTNKTCGFHINISNCKLLIGSQQKAYFFVALHNYLMSILF